MKISYEFEIKRIAYLPSGSKGEMTPVGEFEQNSRDGDTCKMTVKLFKGIPDKLIELIKEMPEVLVMRESRMKSNPIVILPEAHDSLIIPGS